MSGRAVALIDCAAVEANCRRLRRELAGGVEFCAVVKAGGYGHGMVDVAKAARAGGADRLAVATADETEALARALPGVSILTLGALTPEDFEKSLSVDAEVTVWNADGVRVAADRARALGRRGRVHVKFDSGMGRHGTLDPAEAVELARFCSEQPDLELTGLWTHFATADEEDASYFELQLDRFSAVASSLRQSYPDLRVHAANSAATLRDSRAHFDMVRCGIAIYGLDPFGQDARARELEPALSLRSYVATLRRFEAGQSAGYGRTWRADRETWIGTLPIGYGDGVLRVFSNTCELLVGGRRYPIVGNVSMDNLTIDLGPDPVVEVGDEAVLIGRQGGEEVTAEEIAARIGTINYEVTTALSPRVVRKAS